MSLLDNKNTWYILGGINLMCVLLPPFEFVNLINLACVVMCWWHIDRISKFEKDED